MGQSQTWEDFNENGQDVGSERYVKTNILCPHCQRNIYWNREVLYPSNPPRYFYICKCGWTGYSFNRWRCENDMERV